MEKKEEVRTFITRKYCECGEEFKFSSEVRQIDSRLVGHICEKCGNEFWSTKSYPITSYEPINTQEK